ncbi:MAG: type II toxin-antitoxin system Phd/YefM family antitoxin, partial [Parvularculaceae bacterium]
MDRAVRRARARKPLTGPVTMGEFRARLAEMADRVLDGEEIVVMRGRDPIARFAPIEPRPRRRAGVLKELL